MTPEGGRHHPGGRQAPSKWEAGPISTSPLFPSSPRPRLPSSLLPTHALPPHLPTPAALLPQLIAAQWDPERAWAALSSAGGTAAGEGPHVVAAAAAAREGSPLIFLWMDMGNLLM